MLINTVLLFLQSALPIFVITSLLVLRFTPVYGTVAGSVLPDKGIFSMSVIAIVFALLLSQQMENLSQLFEGKGTELLFSFSFIVIYFCSVLIFLLDNKKSLIKVKKGLALIVFLLVCALHGSHFILYLNSYWAKSSQLESFVIGITLGIGICVSFSILVYFLLRYLDTALHYKFSCYFLLLFAIGQLMHAVRLLQQVDLLPLSEISWNSTKFITENSEYGRLLHVLFGYESTPSYMQLILYFIAFIVPVIISGSRLFTCLTYGEKS